MHIGNRMYDIGNLVATSIGTRHVGFQGGPLKAIWSKKRRFLLIAVGLLILGSIEDPTGAVYLGEAALVVLAAVTVTQIVRMLRERRIDYVLQLETSGSITGIVAIPDPDAIRKLAKLVADATKTRLSRPST